MSSSHRELIARRSTPLTASTPTTRARVEVSNDVARSEETPSRFMFPIGTHESIADVRARISRTIAGDAVARRRETDVALSPSIALSVDGYALLDEDLAMDVVRDDDVVRVATSPLFANAAQNERGAIDAIAHHGYVRTPLGRVFASLAPAVSEEEEVEEERRNKPSRSARRKSNKRAKRRAAFDTIEDLQIVSDEEGEGGEQMEVGEAVRGVTTTAMQEQQQQQRLNEKRNARHRLEYRPEPLPDYDAKPKRTPEELYKNVRTPEWASDDVIRRHREERYEEMRRAAEADPRDAWERFVFKSEMTDEELREFPLAESFKMNDIIAYKIFLNEGSGPSSAYYQGRVMRYDGASGTIRIKPCTEDRVGVTGELFFKLGVRAPAPYDKLGVYDGPVAGLSEVRLIGGRSVWEGDLPSKIWTVGRNKQTPPGWQAGQRETPEEYESWFTEHIRIHEYQRANARKWDEEIREGDRQGKWRSHRSRPHRHDRQKRQRHNEEDESAHIWPTSAEELQAKLMAEWQAEEASNALLRRDEKSAPTPGAPPANIPGVEIAPSSDNQPPPPPGSPPPPKPAETEHPSSMDARTVRRRARASTAAAMARFRAEGDLPPE